MTFIIRMFFSRGKFCLSNRPFLRNYATVRDGKLPNGDDIKKLISSSYLSFNKKLVSNEPSQFSYPLIRSSFSKAFLKANLPYLTKESEKIKSKALSFVEDTNELKIGLPKIMTYLITPNNITLPKVAYYLLSNEDKIDRLPIKLDNLDKLSDTEKPQKIMDILVEKIMYSNFKPYFLQHIYNDKSNNQNFNDNLTLNMMDVDNPFEWFPEARKLKRKFIMHVGPTNSGKTYNALKRLENCSKGYFAGPLRLLAREVYDKYQQRNIRCNLVTGEEVIVDIDETGNRAGLTSGTIEMISLSDTYDVIVVDEIQMIGDVNRGSAWTSVILGAKAKEIHLCGEASSIPLIKKLVAMTGDDLEINEYKRLGKLIVDDEPVTVHDLTKGDCIVCFSKSVILDMKSQVEKQTGLKCAVIYGALPPETRAQEAQRFNDGHYDVVIASDAIGMGLNLRINRIIFTTTQKYNGKNMVQLTSSNVKQIGGRAGRFGVGEGAGHITAISKEELEIVKESIDAPIEYLEKAVLWPPDGLWVRYYSMFTQDTELTTMYRKFETDLSKHYRRKKDVKRDFEIQSLLDIKTMAKFYEKEKILKNFYILDQLQCISCPSTVSGSPMRALKYITDNLHKEFMLTIINRLRKSIFDFPAMPFYLTSTDDIIGKPDLENVSVSVNNPGNIEIEPVPENIKKEILKTLQKSQIDEFQNRRTKVKKISPVEERLMKLEQFHRAMGTYMWLSYRFPQSFIDVESAIKLRELIEYKISEMLSNLRASNKLDKKKFKTF